MDSEMTTLKSSKAQKETIRQLATLEDKTISKTILEACKLLAEKHGIEWPEDDSQWGGDRKSGK